MIRPIATSLINEYWPRVLPLLQPAIDHGRRAKAPDVRQWLMRGDYQLWVCGNAEEIKAAATTSITVYPGSKWLTIVHCGGKDAYGWLADGIDALETWAVGNGCEGVEGIGRPEWARVLPGYEATGTMFERRVMPERRAA